MGYNAPIEMLERLAKEYDHLIGVNLTTPDIMHLTEAVARSFASAAGDPCRRPDARHHGDGDGRQRLPVVRGGDRTETVP